MDLKHTVPEEITNIRITIEAVKSEIAKRQAIPDSPGLASIAKLFSMLEKLNKQLLVSKQLLAEYFDKRTAILLAEQIANAVFETIKEVFGHFDNFEDLYSDFVTKMPVILQSQIDGIKGDQT